MKNDISIGSMTRHKLIDCTEFFSKSMAKKAANEVANRKISIERPSSITWNLRNTMPNEISDESDSLIRQRRSKSRLRSLLAKDFNESVFCFVYFDDYNTFI